MLDGIYQNASAMSGLESWNNAIAQNLAQLAAPGYKKAMLSFEGQARGTIGYKGPFDQTLQRESISASGVGSIDFSPGSIVHTDSHTDFAIEGAGFFELRAPDGQHVYTRDGEFKVNDEGELVSKQGYHVMSDDRSIIQLIPDGGKLEGARDGTLRQNGQRIGVLALRDFDDYQGFIRSHGGFVMPDSANANMSTIEGTIRNGAIEKANVSATHEMVNMINISRSFQLNQSVIKNRDDLLTRAIQSLGGRG